MGVTVNRVRVRSIEDFGSVDVVGTRLLEAERKKVNLAPSHLQSFEQPCAGAGRQGSAAAGSALPQAALPPTAALPRD